MINFCSSRCPPVFQTARPAVIPAAPTVPKCPVLTAVTLSTVPPPATTLIISGTNFDPTLTNIYLLMRHGDCRRSCRAFAATLPSRRHCYKHDHYDSRIVTYSWRYVRVYAHRSLFGELLYGWVQSISNGWFSGPQCAVIVPF